LKDEKRVDKTLFLGGEFFIVYKSNLSYAKSSYLECKRREEK
jgi:hypothetical protein